MAILKALFKFFLILAVLGVIGIFVAREVLLVVALNQVMTDFQKLEKRVAKGEFTSYCTRLGSFKTQGMAQLRFLDKQTYTLEVICDQIQSNPVTVEKKQLPLLVMKAYGDSGLMSGLDQDNLGLQVLGRFGLVQHTASGNLTMGNKQPPADQALNGPPTMCAGYGLTCCQESEQQGHGRAIQGAIDCPKTCYEGCWARPVVLGFNTQPFYDPVTRVVEVAAGEEVTFDYTVSETQADLFADTPIKEQKNPVSVVLAVIQTWFEAKPTEKTNLRQVTVSFGDGEQSQLTDLGGTVTHKYACKKPKCLYEATITASNQQGAESQKTQLGSVKVSVTP